MWMLVRLFLAFIVAVSTFGAMNRPYVSAEGLRRVPTGHSPLNKAVMAAGAGALVVLLVFWKDPLKPE
jgi:hypothetical protein